MLIKRLRNVTKMRKIFRQLTNSQPLKFKQSNVPSIDNIYEMDRTAPSSQLQPGFGKALDNAKSVCLLDNHPLNFRTNWLEHDH